MRKIGWISRAKKDCLLNRANRNAGRGSPKRWRWKVTDHVLRATGAQVVSLDSLCDKRAFAAH
jgi:hypothetical protein